MTLKSVLEVTQVIQPDTIRKRWCSFLFGFHGNYSSILNHFRDKARYWSKIVIFSYPLHSMPPLWGSLSEYCHPVWYGKTRMARLPGGKKIEDTFSGVHRIPACECVRWTDILHSPRYAYMHTSHAVKQTPLKKYFVAVSTGRGTVSLVTNA